MYDAERRKMIRKADRLARRTGRAWIVLSTAGALSLHDSAAHLAPDVAAHTCPTAIVYPDGTYHAGGMRHPIALAYC